MITADHKVLSEGCESRNNHRYAVVVQDLATQWIQAYPCKKQKLHRKLKEACKSSWSPTGSIKSFTLSFPWNSAKLVKISLGIIARLHHTDQKQNGIAERAVRGVKEGTSAVLLQSGLNKVGGQIPWNVTPICETSQIYYLLERRPMKDVLGNHLKGPIIPFGSLVEYHPITAQDQSRIHQFGKKVLPGFFLGYALYAERIWKGNLLVADLEELETMDASEIYSKRLNAKEVIFPTGKGEFIFRSQMDESNTLEEIKT